MKLNRRQLRRLIESTIYEQALDKGMSKGEKEDAKQAKDKKDQDLVDAIASLLSGYLGAPALVNKYVRDTRDILDKFHTDKARRIKNPSDFKKAGSRNKRFKELDSQLAVLFDKTDKVITNKVGLDFMKGDVFADLGLQDNPDNLGAYLKDKVGFDNLKKYPHIYALYSANA